MTLALNYPAVSAYDWKPLVTAPGEKNIFRNPLRQIISAASKWPRGYEAGIRRHHPQVNVLSHLLDGLGETLALVGLSIGLLTLFAGLSLL